MLSSAVSTASMYQAKANWHGTHAGASSSGPQSGLQALQISGHILIYVTVLQLSELDISNNKLTGTLPSSWGSLAQVRMLSTLLLYHCLTTTLSYSMYGDWLIVRSATRTNGVSCLSGVIKADLICLHAETLAHCESLQSGLGGVTVTVILSPIHTSPTDNS